MIQPVPPASAQLAKPGSRDAALMDKARDLEAAFLSEMLSFSGLGAVSEGFGGGAGEDQFGSFLRAEQARIMVDKGGIGLAEMIFESLKARGAPDDDSA